LLVKDEDLKNSILKTIEVNFSKNLKSFNFLGEYEVDNKPTKDLIFCSYKKLGSIIDVFFISLLEQIKKNSTYHFLIKDDKFDQCVKDLFKYITVKSNTVSKVLLKEYVSVKNRNNQQFEMLIIYIKSIKKYYSYNYISCYTKLRNCHAPEILDENKIHLCPYCKRNYINIVTIDKKKNDLHIKPDLDHYYAKALYPFLAISIENLIPSCQTCNSRLKKEKDFYIEKHYQPLIKNEDIFEQIEFGYLDDQIYIKNLEDFKNNQKAKNTIETFHIKEVYSSHHEVVFSLKNKYKRYTKANRTQLKKLLPTLTESVLLDIVFYEYRHINKKTEPLYKLKKDLYKIIVES